jgi:phosphate transport system protein
MFRHLFEEKLLYLQDDVLVLGGYAEEALVEAIKVLREHDPHTGNYVIANHRNIRRKYSAIEMETLTLLATQQPMARDLRLLTSFLEIAMELAHIAANAREIAEVSLKLIKDPLHHAYENILRMDKQARQMLRLSLEAVANQDVAQARCIPAQDIEVDALYRKLHQQLIATIKADHKGVGQGIYMLQISHQLERAADRTTNICEWVIFAQTGEMEELNIKAHQQS